MSVCEREVLDQVQQEGREEEVRGRGVGMRKEREEGREREEE